MADNNPAGDNVWTNTPDAGVIEFDSMPFDDVEVGDLIWLVNILSTENHAYRKVDDVMAMDTRTRKIVNIQSRTIVYQKT